MNNYTILNARLVADPKNMQLGGKNYTECRVADNPAKKTNKDGSAIKSRFVSLKFWEFQAGLAAKLSKGDVIVPTGELGIETYTDKKTNQPVDKDIMRVNSFAVVKSDSFFVKDPPAVEAAEETQDELPF